MRPIDIGIPNFYFLFFLREGEVLNNICIIRVIWVIKKKFISYIFLTTGSTGGLRQKKIFVLIK